MGVSAANGKEKKQRRIVIASAFRFLEMRSLEESGVNKKKLAQSREKGEGVREGRRGQSGVALI
jgi:hypothetical protein